MSSRLPAQDRPTGAPVYLQSWDIADHPVYLTRRNTPHGATFLRLVGNDGSVGFVPAWVSRGATSGGDPKQGRREPGLSEATVSVLRETDLRDHRAVHRRLSAAGVAGAEIAAADIACWDLDARREGKPLHALIGTARRRAVRYGDVRGTQPDFSPAAYAEKVAKYLRDQKLQATKLHFPGAMGTQDSISFAQVKETLRRIREATGPEPILAYDPYPHSAESATPSLDEARELLDLLRELKFAWVEGPLPPEPEAEQLAKYTELMRVARIRVQPEGSGRIGDLSPVAALRRWAEAGAADQFSTDCYFADGITPVVEFIGWLQRQPPGKFVLNLHWSWLPHVHLAMTCDEILHPYVEVPMSNELPLELFVGSPFVQAPDWPGIYRYDGA